MLCNEDWWRAPLLAYEASLGGLVDAPSPPARELGLGPLEPFGETPLRAHTAASLAAPFGRESAARHRDRALRSSALLVRDMLSFVLS